MRLALAQMKMDQDTESNYRKSIEYIRLAAEGSADMICFPEIQLTPFFPQYKIGNPEDYAITLGHTYIQGIREACAENGIFASPNFYVKENGPYYDMSLLIDDKGGIIGKQKMVHIAQCEKFYEQSYYTPSEEGFSVFDTKFGKVGIVVCFDRHYPESIRTEALKGADLILIPTANTTAEPSNLFQWEVRVQAFQNSVNIAMCIRVGIEDGMEFSGESLVSDYDGNIIALAEDEECLVIADVDLKAAADARAKKPYTNLRRTDLYE